MRHLILILFLGIQLSFFAQELSVHLSESYIEIGTPVRLSYEVRGLNRSKIEFTPFETFIPTTVKDSSGKQIEGPNLEIISAFKDSIHDNIWTGEYVVTCWDSAIVNVLGPKIHVNDKILVFDAVTIKSDFVAPEKGRDIYEIREQKVETNKKILASENKSFLSTYWWILALIIIPLIALTFFVLRKRRTSPIAEISLRDKTINAIQQLENSKLWDKGELKQHYVELSYILRQYLSERYELSLMELTSTEITLILQRNNLDPGLINHISNILNASDMVKFAKSQPEVYAILKVSGMAKEIVITTSPSSIENAE